MADENLEPVGGEGGGEAPAADNLRGDLERAFEQVETRDAPDAPDKGAPAAAPAAAQPGERARGPDGRFAPVPPAGAPEKAQGAPDKPAPADAPKPALAAQQKPPAQAAAPAPGAGDTVGRAPVSWKPQARESWAKLPAEVRQEVTRREAEVSRVMQESSRAREALQHVQGVLGPYSANIAASGSDAMGFLNNFLQADNTLRHGSLGDKAQLVANIIKQYGVDIQALDSVLAGQSVAPDPNAALADQLRKEMQKQLQPVMGYFNQMRGRQQQALQQINTEVGSEVEQFREQAEFYEDVREDMADIIDLATARGQPMSLQQAYDRAILLHPQVSEIVSRRAEAGRVNAQAQAAQRARRAAASISGSPAPAGGPGAAGDDRRALIEAAWDQSSGS